MYLDVKLEIYYALCSSELRKRVEKFLYDSIRADAIIVNSYNEEVGFHRYRLFICQEAINAKWLEALAYMVNSYDYVSHCVIQKKKFRKWRNPFKKS